jgi:hypothetical protein
MPTVLILGFVVLVLLFIALGVFSYLREKKRREAFRLDAESHGWTYADRDDRWVDAFDGAPFGLGHGRRAENVVTGTYEDRPFAAYDYSYRTTETSTDAEGHTTTHEETHNFSVVAMEVPGTFPNLHVSPEGFFGRMVGRLTNHDIELESEDFNRAFTVHCDDRKFASDILHPRLMETLLAHYRDLDWRFDHSWIVTIGTGSNDLVDTQRAMDALATIIATVPDFVWQDRGAANPPANA